MLAPDAFSTQAVHDLEQLIQLKMNKLERFNMFLILKDRLRAARKLLQEKHINSIRKFQLHLRRILTRRKTRLTLRTEVLEAWEHNKSQLNSSFRVFEGQRQQLSPRNI